MENAQDNNSAACGQSRSTAGLCLCDGGVRIVYEHGKPHGIRDWGGYLFFFRNIMKYEGQDARYRAELEQQQSLADFLLDALQRHNVEVRGASRLAGEASSAEGATSTVMLGDERPGKD